jgi:predicted metal-dependent hydrolase
LPSIAAEPAGEERRAPAEGRVFRYGVDLFNAGYWWEAHEVWEGFWRRQPRGTAKRDLLQGLIFLAAAHLKWWSGTEAGRHRLFARALQRLRSAARRSGEPVLLGLEPEALAARFAAWQAQGQAPCPREDLLAGMPRIELSGE